MLSNKASVISFNKNEKYWEMSKQFWRLESIKKYQEIILNLQVFRSVSNPNYKWLVGCSIFSTWNWPNFLGWLWVFFTLGKYSTLFLQIFILLRYLSSPLLGLPFQYVRLLDIIWQITEALLFFSIKKKIWVRKFIFTCLQFNGYFSSENPYFNFRYFSFKLLNSHLVQF